MNKCGTKYFLLALFLLVSSSSIFAQRDSLVNAYLFKYKNVAMEEMRRTGIPASITLAQALHESGFGIAPLALQSNNHFGIKCKSNWTGKTVKHDDDAKQECFRSYDSPIESFKDHSDFLKSGDRYAFLFNYNPKNYAMWANGLKKAGYATNPKYPQVLIELIETYHLNDYTLQVLGDSIKEGVSQIKEETKPQPKLVFEEKKTLPSNVEKTNANQPILLDIPVEETVGDSLPGEYNNSTVNIYPKGVFKINGCNVIYVPKGLSLLALAAKNNITLGQLIEWNDMPERQVLEHDQLIFLQKKQRTGSSEKHLVKDDESWWIISQREGIRLQDLLAYNHASVQQVLFVGNNVKLRQ